MYYLYVLLRYIVRTYIDVLQVCVHLAQGVLCMYSYLYVHSTCTSTCTMYEYKRYTKGVPLYIYIPFVRCVHIRAYTWYEYTSYEYVELVLVRCTRTMYYVPCTIAVGLLCILYVYLYLVHIVHIVRIVRTVLIVLMSTHVVNHSAMSVVCRLRSTQFTVIAV